MLQLHRPLFGTSSVLWGSQLPWSVHRWRAPVGFPPRPSRADSGPPGSRAWCFHTCSGSCRTTAPGPTAPRHSRCSGCCLRLRRQPRHLNLNSISRLNTRPAWSPVNASVTPSRTCPHDSGSSWVASPSACEFLLRYTMPVYPGASPGASCPMSSTRIMDKPVWSRRHLALRRRGPVRCTEVPHLT